jgi:dTMP kinase
MSERERSAPAKYIALEGAEGCGKSTHAALLARALDAVLTRETGGTPIGKRIRNILHDNEVGDLADRAEALLTAADRAQHSEGVIKPGLAAGRHVVSDRSVYSTLAYQGYGRRLPIDEVRRINEWALGGCWPDLVLLLVVEPHELERRMRGRHLDRFERETAEFHARVRDGFCRMAAEDPSRWVVIDGSGPQEMVAAAVSDAVRKRLGIG